MSYSSSIQKGVDHVYYNIAINTNKVSTRVATVTDTRGQPLIDNPEQYTLSIIRATIPALFIPIFQYPVVYTGYIPSANPTIYSVTLRYGGNDYRAHLTYVSESPLLPTTDLEYYSIYSFKWFIDIINTAFANAFTALKTANPAAPMTQPPYMIYNNDTYLIDLIVQKQYVGNVNVYMNGALYNFFESYKVIYGAFNSVNGKDVEILLYNNNNNCFSECPQNIVIGTTSASSTITSAALFNINMDGATITGAGIPENTKLTYNNASQMTMSQNATATATINAVIVNDNLLKIQQDYQTSQLWSDLDSLIITSNGIPINDEYTPSISNNQNGIIEYGNNVSYLRILADFEPDLKLAYEQRAIYQYVPQAEFRRIDLKGNVPLDKLDIQVFWKDLRGVIHPLYLGPYGQGVNIKMLFEKKNAYKTKGN